jgi:Na+-transporting methylmalonyl-CoA/oxaloacetate decarboxylase gamma subunit
MIGIAELVVIAGVVFVLLGLVVLILLISIRGRRRERERQERQIDSVYNNRERRKRGN